MRILHTADWHLGKKLEQCERVDEHQDFLDWLIEKLNTECIDVLIVAGDIFDTGSPSNTALEQYYRFLRQVKNTCCREVVIIGGNHDSISTLNAPKDLLKYFNVHIIGGVPDEFTDQIIHVRDKTGELQLVICAVPFLRDKDIRLSVSGETDMERETRIKQGIANHYHRFTEHITDYKAQNVPVIATGHLFAAGSSTSDSEKEIHVGNLGQVGADEFPPHFDYVALGHIHRPQLVNKAKHIRYSGSPISLSFSETDDKKQVVILEFKEGELHLLEEHEIPCNRKLIRIKGDLDTIKRKVMLLEDYQLKYPAWVEVQVETESFIHGLDEELEQFKGNKPYIERFFPRQIRKRKIQNLDEQTAPTHTLNDISPKEVFIKKCQAEFGQEDFSSLVQTFELALEQLSQKETNP